MLRGVQLPQFELVPPATSSAGLEVVELAASGGLVLEPHQAHVLEGALGEKPDGRWAAFEVAVVEPRQNGKGGIITARELGGLFLFGEELQTHTAHRFDTCLEGFRRIRDIIDGTPDFSRRVRRIIEAHGQEAIELFNPTQRLLFKARAKGSGRGFSGDTVYLDEAFWLNELGAMLPTMSARPNPQLWYLSSAPLPAPISDILRRLCTRGRKGRAKRLYFAEWCAQLRKFRDGDLADWKAAVAEVLDSHEAWAEANPGLGYRITAEFIQSERDAMTDEEFARERLGLYPPEVEVLDPAISEDDWAACRTPRSTREGPSKAVDPVVIAFEVNVDRDAAVIAAAGVSTLGGTHVEVLDQHRATGWVVPRLLELQQNHSPAEIVCHGPGPAGGLLADCEKAGLVVETMTTTEFAQACAAAYDDIAEHRWRHIAQPELDRAVAGATKRDSGDAFVFDRRGKVDISAFIAVTLAAKRVDHIVDKTSVYEDRGMVVLD